MAHSYSDARSDLFGKVEASCRPGLAAVAVFSVFANILLMTGPIFMLQVYDRVLTSRSVPTLVALVVLATTLYAFAGLLDTLRMRLMSRLSNLLDHHAKKDAFDYYASAPLKGGAERQSLNPVQDLQVVRRFLSNPAAMAFFDLPWMPIYLGLLFLLHPTIAWFGIAGGLLLVVIAFLNEIGTRKGYAQVFEATGRGQNVMQAARRNVAAVTAMGMQSTLRELWAAHHAESVDAADRAAKAAAIYGSISKTLRMAIQSLMLGLGAYLVIEQEMSAGSIIASSIIFARALAPVETAVSQWRVISEARFALRRLKRALNEMADADTMSGELPAPSKSLRVDDVAVAAPGTRVALISGVNFELAAGDGLGILGPSASGKSTLAKALVGVWSAGRGSLRLDGAEHSQWSAAKRGAFIGYLPQEIELLDGTVAENIARFQPDASFEKIVEAADLAGAHDMIVSLPKGYETRVGMDGIQLSGGQQQRIALARAIFGNPFLLVLDEPNSNLDPKGEQALAEAIAKLRKRGSIVIVITHRTNAVDGLNKLLLMEDGMQRAFGDKEKVFALLTESTSKRVKEGLKVVG